MSDDKDKGNYNDEVKSKVLGGGEFADGPEDEGFSREQDGGSDGEAVPSEAEVRKFFHSYRPSRNRGADEVQDSPVRSIIWPKVEDDD